MGPRQQQVPPGKSSKARVCCVCATFWAGLVQRADCGAARLATRLLLPFPLLHRRPEGAANTEPALKGGEREGRWRRGRRRAERSVTSQVKPAVES